MLSAGLLLLDVYWLTTIGLRRREFAGGAGPQERFFVQSAASPQQFQKRIFSVGICGTRLVQVYGVGDERTRRYFQLRGGAGLASEELDKFTYALTLLFGAGREFDAHAMSGVHDPN